MVIRRWLLIVALALAPAWAGAAGSFYGQEVRPGDYGGTFQLTDHNGQARTLADFRGRAVAVFFGYTQCPDFCPTTLVKMAAVMKQLGPDAVRLQVLFVTIDPRRDSLSLLSHYVPQFDPSFLGLRGDEAQTASVVEAFKVRYQIMKYMSETLIDHTASGYLVDPQGKTRLLLPYTMSAEQIASDVRTILNQG